MKTERRKDGQTDRLTDKASYRVTCTRLKLSNKAKWKENKENEKYEK